MSTREVVRSVNTALMVSANGISIGTMTTGSVLPTDTTGVQMENEKIKGFLCRRGLKAVSQRKTVLKRMETLND